ncbi:MAG TPA: nuclear transport factor 2 family protein [Sphingomicrobium sp.]|nr:nuclear transport factor 2 family protein [Sphingomicrobium sp.]
MSFRKAITPSLLAVSLIALAACKPQEPAKAPEAAAMVPTDAEAAKIVDDAEAAWTSVDTAKIMASYKEGAVMFDVVAAGPSTDRATQNKWTDGFTAMKLTENSIADKHVQVLDADTIIASGIATLKSGDKGEPVMFRYTDVYEKQPDGKWMIVHEHLSTPPAGEA